MIKSFKSKRLQAFYNGDYSKVDPRSISAIRLILAALESAVDIRDCELIGRRLHQHKGVTPTRWSLDVSGNWRITFEFRDSHVYAVDYEDPH